MRQVVLSILHQLLPEVGF